MTGWARTSAAPAVIGRMKLTSIDWPIAAIPLLVNGADSGAGTDALYQGRHDAAVHQPERLAQLVADLTRTRASSGSSLSHSVPTSSSK